MPDGTSVAPVIPEVAEAVSVMFCPTIPFVVLGITVTVASMGNGVTVTAVDVLPFQFVSPLYTAVTGVAVADRNVTDAVATPFATVPLPRNLFPA